MPPGGAVRLRKRTDGGAREHAYRAGMQLMPPTQVHIMVLERHQDEIEQRLQACRDRVESSDRPDPSLGRELDDAHAALAKVHAELARLAER
jgi:hypothetical protein